MNKQLLKTLVSMPSGVLIIRTPSNLLKQCKCFSTGQQLFRGYNHANCISRSYSTMQVEKVRKVQKRPPLRPPRQPMSKRTFWGLQGVLVVVFVGSFFVSKYLAEERKKRRTFERKKSAEMASIPARPFDLVDINGNKVTRETFLGKWVLIYFGFCYPPNVCRDYLNTLTSVVETVNAIPHIPKLQPVFITVEPKEDENVQIKGYLRDFHPDFIGLTGSVEEVKRVSKAYCLEDSACPEGDKNDYIIDHKVSSFLVDPNGNFSAYLGESKEEDQLVSAIATRMAKMVGVILKW